MISSDLTWVGHNVGQWYIEEQLAESYFSWIFKGRNQEDGSFQVFKVAKPWEQIPGNYGGEPAVTEAKAAEDGSVRNVTPDTMQLLLEQGRQIRSLNHPAFVSINEIIQEPNFCYLRMEYIDGQNFRQLMSKNQIGKGMILELLNILAELKALPAFSYHGDIKPENLMVAQGKVRILDPGFFGVANCAEAVNQECAVTTTAYYPLLRPDDILACGILLWEAVLKFHPLLPSMHHLEESIAGDNLCAWIGTHRQADRHFLDSLLRLPMPRQVNRQISLQAEQVLLKALRLELTAAGKIDRSRGYADLAELAGDLKNIEFTAT